MLLLVLIFFNKAMPILSTKLKQVDPRHRCKREGPRTRLA